MILERMLKLCSTEMSNQVYSLVNNIYKLYFKLENLNYITL